MKMMKWLLNGVLLITLCFSSGCIVDGPALQEDYDSKQVLKDFFAGKNTANKTMYGVCPALISAYYIPIVFEPHIDTIYGINLSDLYTQNKKVEGLNLAAGFAKNDKMSGVSLVGIASISQELSFFEIAGLASIARREMSGVQLSGLVSWAEESSGLQLAGLWNHTDDDFNGLQIAPFNTIGDADKAIQFGAVNFVERTYGVNAHAVQLGAVNFANTWGSNDNAIQLGAVNLTDEFDGGAQLGVVNLSKDFEGGAQIGAFNYTDELKGGVQVGVFNYNESTPKKTVDMEMVMSADGTIKERPVEDYETTPWQFGLINRTASGLWLPFTNFGLF